jgi:hypothetical protein
MVRVCCVGMLLLLTGGCGQLSYSVPDFIQPHRSADECSARGQQIDASTEQCVAAPPKAASQSAKARARVAAQSVTAMAETLAEPVEPDADIDRTLKDETKLISGLVGLVRAHGYRCDTISAVKTFSTSNGFKLACDRFSDKYDIRDRGGHLVVTVD